MTSGTNTFPSTLVTTNTTQFISAQKVFTGGSGSVASEVIAPTTDTRCLKIVRGTDTTPAQPLLDIRDHADSTSIFIVSSVGDVTANSISCFNVTSKAGNFGHFFGSDATALTVQRGTDTSPTADIMKVTDFAGTTTFFKVAASGDITIAGQLSVAGADVTGAWNSWSPAWTATTTNPVLGNGTLTGFYKQVGKTTYWSLRLAIGSTTTLGTGTWILSLPFTASGHYATLDNVGSGVANVSAAASCTTATTRLRAGLATVDVILGLGNLADGTHPAAWANGNVLSLSGTYEAA